MEAIMRLTAIACTAACLVPIIDAAYAQDFPSRPIRIITAEAGGTNDFAVRSIVPGVSAGVGQQLIVDNRGPGVIPSTAVAKAAPDGYTLLLHGSSIWLSSFFQSDVPYDALRDFAPI